jgi:tRNA threonylcarbamoyladenosine biosynthesis protein TsaB
MSKPVQPKILAIDTATPLSTVALTAGDRSDGTCIAAVTLGGSVTHSRQLLPAIDWLMKRVDMGWEAVDGIAVSLGPGSFTGLRIGMATAKGLAAGAGKRLYGVSTLDGLASRCTSGTLICALLDARKKEVYGAFYRCDGRGLTSRVTDIFVMRPEDLADRVDEPILLVGDGAVTYRRLFMETLGGKCTFAPAMLHEPSALSLGMLGAEKMAAGEELDISTAVPLYVRSSDAELSLRKKSGK